MLVCLTAIFESTGYDQLEDSDDFNFHDRQHNVNV
jgi:hypothetical protein